MVDPLRRHFAVANMIRLIFDVVRTGQSARQVEAGNVDAYAVTGLEQAAGREDLDPITPRSCRARQASAPPASADAMAPKTWSARDQSPDATP